jgi:hypothetical protein
MGLGPVVPDEQQQLPPPLDPAFAACRRRSHSANASVLNRHDTHQPFDLLTTSPGTI